MVNKLSYRKNRVHYNTEETEETEETETVDRETGEVITVETAEGVGEAEKKQGSAIVGLMILIFMMLMVFGIIYFWYWIFKNVFSIIRGN